MPPPPPQANKSAARKTTVERPATRILFNPKVQELMLPLHVPWVCQAAGRTGFPSRSDLVSDKTDKSVDTPGFAATTFKGPGH